MYREELFKTLGYTCCAGIGAGKIAAKLAVDLVCDSFVVV